MHPRTPLPPHPPSPPITAQLDTNDIKPITAIDKPCLLSPIIKLSILIYMGHLISLTKFNKKLPNRKKRINYYKYGSTTFIFRLSVCKCFRKHLKFKTVITIRLYNAASLISKKVKECNFSTVN